MRKRISRVLGDPKKVFGPDWTAKIAQCFTDADYACARAILKPEPPARFVGVLREAGEFLAAQRGQWVVAASTMEGLLGHLLQVSLRSRCGPDEVRIDQASGKIELLLRGAPLAHLEAISPLPVNNYALDRAEACLSPDGFCGEEHMQDRLRAWLPLADAAMSSECERARIPSAAGWLIAASQLAGQHGVHDATPSLDERLAAAILGASNWQLLAADRSTVANACGPWYLEEGEAGQGRVAIYSSPLHAAAALLEALSTGRLFAGRPSSLWMDVTPAGYPTMTLDGTMTDGLSDDGQGSPDRVAIRPCEIVNPSERWIARASRALQVGDARSIELAFGAYWPRDERLRAYDRYHGHRLLAQSGNWRFTVNAAGRPKVLHAHRIDSTGRSVFQAGVRTRYGYLLRFQHLKEYVLTAYWMREPVAVIDGIDKPTAEVVSDVLRGAVELRHLLRSMDADSRRDLKSLMASIDCLRAGNQTAVGGE